jgi:hypothetical protein
MKVILGKLENAEELAGFLEKRTGVKPKVENGIIEIQEENSRKIKTYIKRYLHNRGLRERFRVLVRGEELTLQMVEEESQEEEE